MIVGWNDSAIDPSRAPAGKALMKFVVLSVPYLITGDATGRIVGHTWDEAREPYADYLIELITANYIPDLKAKILKRVAHSPVDISRRIISAVRGTLGQGAFVPYQSGSLRPIPELGGVQNPSCQCLPVQFWKPSWPRCLNGSRKKRSTGNLR